MSTAGRTVGWDESCVDRRLGHGLADAGPLIFEFGGARMIVSFDSRSVFLGRINTIKHESAKEQQKHEKRLLEGNYWHM
jgi:hypothetical protein